MGLRVGKMDREYDYQLNTRVGRRWAVPYLNPVVGSGRVGLGLGLTRSV